MIQRQESVGLETTYGRTPRKKRKRGIGILFILFIAAALVSFGWFGYINFVPSKERQEPRYSVDNPIISRGEETSYGALIENGQAKLPLPLLEQLLGEDKPIHYEAKSGTIVFTTVDKVLRLKTDALTGLMNEKSYKLTIAAEVVDDVVYIPVAPLEELFGFKVEYDGDSGIVTLLNEGDVIQLAEALSEEGAAVRVAPSIREPYLFKAPQGESVRIWKETDGWLLIQSKDGHIGYMNKKDLKLISIERVPELAKTKTFVPWKVMGKKINLTWEAVYNQKVDPSKIGEMPGVNVVSPTWFELEDGKDSIKGKADSAYVK